jgi:hypothetical protein
LTHECMILFYKLTLVLLCFSGRLPTGFESAYRISSEMDLKAASDKSGLPGGSTVVYTNSIRRYLTFPWYAAEVYLYERTNGPFVVAFSGHRIFSSNATCLAFFQGTNLLQSYAASAFLDADIKFYPWICPITKCFSWQGGSDKSFYAERRDARILEFDLTTGRLVGSEIKYRSLAFTDWFEMRRRKLSAAGGQDFVVGELAWIDRTKNVLSMNNVNELFTGRAMPQYIVNFHQIDSSAATHRVWWFLTRSTNSGEGLLIEGAPLGDLLP